MPDSISADSRLRPRLDGLPAPVIPGAAAPLSDAFVTFPSFDKLSARRPNTAREAKGRPPATVIPLPRPAPDPLVRAWQKLPVKAATAGVRTVHDNNTSWLCAWNILASAHKKIDASYFILNRDVFGYAYLGMLLRKKLEGADVHLSLDATGDTLGIYGFTEPLRGEDYLQELVDNGASVSIYNPYYKKLPRQVMHPTSALGISANHDKILATERYAMTGGRNVAAEYFGARDDQPMRFRDSDVIVDGAQAASQLDAAMHAEYDRDDLNQRLHHDMFGNWVKRDAELLGTAAMMDAWINRRPLGDDVKRMLRTSPAARETYADELVIAAKADLAKRRVELGWFVEGKLRKHALELASNPSLAGANRNFKLSDTMVRADVKALDRTSVGSMPRGHDDIDPGLEKLIVAAQDRILITNPYIVLSERVRHRLAEAGKRGVKIDLLTDSPSTSDDPLPQGFFLREWPKLLQHIPNMRIFVLDGDQRMHAKTAVVDGKIDLVGSFNLDLLSSHINGEILETINNEQLAKRDEAQFWRDINDPRNHVREYTIARDAHGKPLLRNGEPIVTYGPENHVRPETMVKYKFWKPLTHLLEKLPQLEPLHRGQ